MDKMVKTPEMITINEMTDRRVTRIGEPSPEVVAAAHSTSWPTTATRVTYGFCFRFFGRDRVEEEAEMERE